MTILNAIATMANDTTTTNRGAVKELILALKSYSKHTGQKLSAKQIATLVTTYIPGTKTSANSVADYQNKLNSGLFDYYSLDDAMAILNKYDQTPA